MPATPLQSEGAFDATLRRQINTNLAATRLVAYAKYDFAVDGGAIGLITPVVNETIPNKAIITNVIMDWTTAVTSGGSATVSAGTSAGSGAASILAATAKASLTGLVQTVPIPSDSTKFVKLTAAGLVTLTVAVAALTAGVCEMWIEYSPATT